MKKASKKRKGDDLRPEYDLSQLEGGVRGKYYGQATAGTNLVLIEPDLTSVDTASAVAHSQRRSRATVRTRRAKRTARAMAER
jgi:hypothetical protein